MLIICLDFIGNFYFVGDWSTQQIWYTPKFLKKQCHIVAGKILYSELV